MALRSVSEWRQLLGKRIRTLSFAWTLPVAQRGLHQRQRGDACGIRAQDAGAQGQPQRPRLSQQQRAFFLGESALRADHDVDPVGRG